MRCSLRRLNVIQQGERNERGGESEEKARKGDRARAFEDGRTRKGERGRERAEGRERKGEREGEPLSEREICLGHTVAG